MNCVKGLILAAGRGSRLGGLTDLRPKALVSLLGRPLIEWQIHSLRAAGISQITAIGGYRAGLLREYLPTLVNERWAETNMVSSLLTYPNSSRGDVIVSYGDIVYSPKAVTKLLSTQADIAVTFDVNWNEMWAARFAQPLDDAESFRCLGTALTHIGQKASSISEIEGQFMGLLKMSHSGWKACLEFFNRLPPSEQDRLDMTGFLFQFIESGGHVQAVPYDHPWAEIDSPSDLALYEGDEKFAGLRNMLGNMAGAQGSFLKCGTL